MFQITYTDTLTQKHTNPSPPPTTESSKIIFVTHIRDSAPHLGTTFFYLKKVVPRCCDIPPSHVWICVCVCVPRCVGVRMCVCAYVRLQACMRNDWLTCLTSVCVSSMVTSKKTKRKCKITMTWPWSWTAQQQQVGQDHLSNPPPPPLLFRGPCTYCVGCKFVYQRMNVFLSVILLRTTRFLLKERSRDLAFRLG